MLTKNKTVIVIQARMNSTRLPGKILMDWGDTNMLGALISRLSNSNLTQGVIVATSNEKTDDEVADYCQRTNINFFRGSEENVLSRLLAAALSVKADNIVRLTADNPFVDGKLVDFVVSDFLKKWPEIDYVSNVDDCGFPFGLFVEVLTTKILKQLNIDSNTYEQEHVTPRLRKSPSAFRTQKVKANYSFPPIGFSVDTLADRNRLLPIFLHLQEQNLDFGMFEISNIDF